jgi:hypothetical protein
MEVVKLTQLGYFPAPQVFVNVCGSSKIPAPGNWKGGKVPEKVQQALEKLAEEGNGEAGAEALRFPLSCGDLHNDLDKKCACAPGRLFPPRLSCCVRFRLQRSLPFSSLHRPGPVSCRQTRQVRHLPVCAEKLRRGRL